MAPPFVLHFLLLLHLVLLLSAGYGSGNSDKCPAWLDCGNLGRIHFPFTKPELQHCGLIAIHNCDDPNPHSNKMIQLEKNGRQLWLQHVVQQPNNMITVYDQELHESLQSKPCEVLKNNITLPPNSPLGSFVIKYNVTMFRCNNRLNVTPPTGFIKYSCPDNNIYYSLSGHPPNYGQRSFSTCLILQFPYKDQPDAEDLQSFLPGQMEIEVQLTNDCDQCYNGMGGQCQLDTNNNFYCDKGTVWEHRSHVCVLSKR